MACRRVPTVALPRAERLYLRRSLEFSIQKAEVSAVQVQFEVEPSLIQVRSPTIDTSKRVPMRGNASGSEEGKTILLGEDAVEAFRWEKAFPGPFPHTLA